MNPDNPILEIAASHLQAIYPDFNFGAFILKAGHLDFRSEKHVYLGTGISEFSDFEFLEVKLTYKRKKKKEEKE